MYLGGASEHASNHANPFKPRSQKDMVVEEVRTLKELASQSAKKPQSKTIRRSIRELLPEPKDEGIVLFPSNSSKVAKLSHPTKSVMVTLMTSAETDPILLQEKKRNAIRETITLLKDKMNFLKTEMGYDDNHPAIISTKDELLSAYNSITMVVLPEKRQIMAQESHTSTTMVDFPGTKLLMDQESFNSSADGEISFDSSSDTDLNNIHG